MASSQESKALKLLKDLQDAGIFGELQSEMDNDNMPAMVVAHLRNPSMGFFSKKLSQFIPGYPNNVENPESILKRDMQYANKNGVFNKFV